MKKLILTIGIITLTTILTACGGRNTPPEEEFINTEEVGFFEFFSHLNPANILIAMDGEYIQPQNPPRELDGNLYLPADFIRTHFDQHFFWEEGNRRLTVSTYDHIFRFTPEATTFTLNWVEHDLDRPIRQVGNMAYMRLDMVAERHPYITFDLQQEYNILIITPATAINTYRVEFTPDDYTALYSTPLRTGAGLAYPILDHLHLSDQLTAFATADGFTRVMLQNGVMGYVQTEMLQHHHTTPPQTIPTATRPITRPNFNGRVNMAWHLVTSHGAAANPANWQVLPGVNAISPTWLYFCRDSMDGTIINFGNREYTAWANQNGKEVWPMISDAFWTASGGPELFSNEAARLVLMDAEIRDMVINQLMNMIHIYGWQGINIDYEAWTLGEVDHFVQFLRELSVPMRQAGAVLSVAVFNPLHFNHWRNYEETAAAVDFLTIMAYDEHYRTAQTAGSVASFPFVRDGILNLLEWGVRPEQIVVGLPTYMRVWVEQLSMETGSWELLPPGPGGNPLPEFYPHRRVRDVGMQFGRNIMNDMGAEFEWDYILRQYVATVYHDHNGTELRTSAWLADNRSTGEKISLVTQHNLGGIAWWQKGIVPTGSDLWQFADNLLQ
ncbi:MAG: glycosyl hydrolase family 18 protein [Defluviitaleaceae bacterium]|nr:glycosyl hydrolase family 18 protein [Defluviitaleaceae bacterium]